MNVDMISTVIREVAQNQAAQFKSAIDSVKADFERRLQEVEAAKAELEKRYVEEIEALKKSLDVSAEIKAIEDLLLEEREQRVADVSSVKSDVDARFKSLDDSLTERETKQAEALESVRKEFSAAVESATKEVRSEIVGIQKQVDTKATAADVEKHLKDAAVSWTAIEQKCAADIQAVREVVEDRSYVESIEKELATLKSDVSEVRKSAAGLDELVKSHVEEIGLLTKAQDESRGEILALKASVEDRSHIETIEKEVGSLKSDLTKSREAAEAADAELRACVDAVSETIGKALSEAIDEQKAEIEKVAKSIEDLPAVPEIPAEIFSLPEVVKAFVAEVSERVEKAEKMASGCVKFAGAWDEEGTYEQGALVVGKNALWVALKDHPSGAIGERDSGWKMVLKSGKLITPYEHR